MSTAAPACYQRPRLLADSVHPVGDDTVELRRGARVLTLTVEGARDLAVAHLRQLRQGAAATDGARHPLADVMGELDALGWIAEGLPPADASVAPELQAIVERGRQAVAALDQATRRALARRLSQPAQAQERRWLGAAARPRCAQDMLAAALCAQCTRESPLFAPVLACILGRRGAPPQARASWREDLRELETSLAATVYWACRAIRAPTPLPAIPRVHWRRAVDAGVALREGEAMLRDWNAAAPAVSILASGRPAREARRIAQGIHLQQYHVSLKYVESLLPVLARNPAAPLRAVLWQYLREELGHEDYELAACMRLGLSEAHVRASVPLPAFSAFHRLMAHAAAAHPIAWVMALPLAEGLPNERKPLPELLARYGLQDASLSAHVALDQAMDHGWMARRIAAGMGSVDAREWRHAATLVAAIWIATRLGWEQVVARFGGARDKGMTRSPWEFVEEAAAGASR